VVVLNSDKKWREMKCWRLEDNAEGGETIFLLYREALPCE
jgi:hypothetical protein